MLTAALLCWALQARAGELLLTAPSAALSLGTTAQLSLSVQTGTSPAGAYLFGLQYDRSVLSLSSLAQEPTGQFSEEFFKGPGLDLGAGAFSGLNSKSLSEPTGVVPLARAAFHVSASTQIFAASQVVYTTVTVPVREVFESPDLLDTAARPIPTQSGRFVFEVIGDTMAPVTSILFSPASATAQDGRPILSTSTRVSFLAVDEGISYRSGVDLTGFVVDLSTSVPLNTSTAAFTLSAGTHTISWASRDKAGNVEVFRSTSVLVKAADVTPPFLTLVPASTVTTATPLVAVVYQDLESGVSTATVRLFLDGVDVTTQAVITASSASLTASVAQGTHTVSAQAADNASNLASIQAVFFVDSLAPVTTLLVNGLAASATTLVLVSTDSLGFAASDSGAGVFETRYSLDGGTETVYASTFSVAAGTHTLSFRSLDAAGNAEAARSVFLTVSSTSTAFSLARLLYPSPLARGVEQAVGRVLRISGETDGPWTLSVATGTAMSFTTLRSSTAAASGFLFAWDTSDRSGFQTLKLQSGLAVSTATVFIGDPVAVYSTSRKHGKSIKDPQGLAVRPDGGVWAALGEEGRLVSISSTGALLATRDPDLKNPHGLALDSLGHVYVADTGNDRVLKLSPDGRDVLLSIGKKDKKGKPVSGSKDGELDSPYDVVVSSDGLIFVADQGNARVQVFNSSGAFVRSFGQIVLSKGSRLWGLAPAAGGLWASDEAQGRLYRFSSSGVLLKVVYATTTATGKLEGPEGLGSDRFGAIYVAETEKDRLQKLDPEGFGLLSFGDKSRRKRGNRKLSGPTDAAMAPDGSLWVSDNDNDRLLRFNLPQPRFAVAAGGEESLGDEDRWARRRLAGRFGGRLRRGDGIGLTLPPGALSFDQELTVGPVSGGDDDRKKKDREGNGRGEAGEQVEYGPEGTRFDVPVTLVMAYDPELLAAQGIAEDSLKIHYWNPFIQAWEALVSWVDKESHVVRAKTTHFSTYQLQGGLGTAASSTVGTLQVACNPMHPGCRPMRFANLPAGATIKIHSLTGVLVKELTSDGAGAATWDGTNNSGAGAASGVYFMIAEGAGGRKVIKLAIER